jgi:tRNA dimethylallyltransferase
MIGELQKDTRRYAKRQLTWFRADPEMHWRFPGARETMVREIQAFFREDG